MNEKPAVKNFAEGVFKAENNSAASLEREKLGKFNNIAIRMFHTGVLTPKEMMYPAIGQFAAKLQSGLEVYRTLYFVNVLKIDMAYVTLILTLIGIYDILNNPLMGALYDRTRTRWGKARPYILFGALPYFISTATLYSGAIFFGDAPGNDARKIVFVFVMLFIQETFSTVYSLPWSQNSHTVYQRVFFLFNGITVMPRVIRMIPYIFYDLVGEKREKMYIALNERRALIANKEEENKELDALTASLSAEQSESRF